MQKFFYLFISALLLLSSCRSENKEAIRSQIQQIDGELVNLRIAINHYQAQMGQAEFDAAVGGFATGYGLTSGDLNLAAEGAAASSRSATQYDTASYSLQELGKRYAELKKRRQDLNSRL